MEPLRGNELKKIEGISNGDAILFNSKQKSVTLSKSKAKANKIIHPAWLSFLSAVLVAAIGAIVAGITAVINIWYFKKQLRQKETEQEIFHLQSLLDTFYGPLLTLKKASKNLHDVLKTTITNSGEVKKESWRTLTQLLQGNDFSENDRTLIKLILDINEEIDNLIGANSGLIESLELQEKVQSLRTHYRLIKAAYEKKITGEAKRFDNFVYPTGLDEELEREVQRLKDTLINLKK